MLENVDNYNNIRKDKSILWADLYVAFVGDVNHEKEYLLPW